MTLILHAHCMFVYFCLFPPSLRQGHFYNSVSRSSNSYLSLDLFYGLWYNLDFTHTWSLNFIHFPQVYVKQGKRLSNFLLPFFMHVPLAKAIYVSDFQKNLSNSLQLIHSLILFYITIFAKKFYASPFDPGAFYEFFNGNEKLIMI